MNAAEWHTPHAMHQDLAASLDFPSYYGHNPDAFHDCLRDIAEDGRGWPPSATGFGLVFFGFDSFATRHPREAWDLLDIIAKQCRAALCSAAACAAWFRATIRICLSSRSVRSR